MGLEARGGGGAGALAGFLGAAGRVGRRGLGAEAPWLIATSNNAAICGRRGPTRLTVASSSSLTCIGFAVGWTCVRTGENAAASSTATQRSGRASVVRFAVVAVANLPASSTGKRTPAFGGCDESFSARTMRPTPIAASMSSNHSASSLSCLVINAAFSSVATARVDSSRATIGSSPAATTLRRSRRSSSSMSAFAASARSSHSATRSRGSKPSAIESNPAAGTSGLPSDLSRVFCSLTAWRTAGRPPCNARSATGRCSSGRSASTAFRWERPGLRRFGFGRCGNSGGAVKLGRLRRSGRGPRSGRVLPPGRSPPGRSPPGRSPPGRSVRGGAPSRRGGAPSRRGRRSPAGPSRRGGRSPRSPRSRFANCWVTASNGLSLGIRSRRPDFSALSLFVDTARIVMPSSSTSASALSTEPIFEPSGRSEPSSTPFGARAPAARHVHVPSGRALVSSISILRDIGPQRYLVQAASLHSDVQLSR